MEERIRRWIRTTGFAPVTVDGRENEAGLGRNSSYVFRFFGGLVDRSDSDKIYKMECLVSFGCCFGLIRGDLAKFCSFGFCLVEAMFGRVLFHLGSL